MPGYVRYRRLIWAQRPVFATSTCTLRRPLSFHYAEVATDNLGGWCREYRPPASGYNTDIGTCTSTCTQFDDDASCTTANETGVLLTGVGGVEPGTTIDLRIANQTRYVPFDATQNHFSDSECHVLENEPTAIECCSLDHVRRSRPSRCRCSAAGHPLTRTTRTMLTLTPHYAIQSRISPRARRPGPS